MMLIKKISFLESAQYSAWPKRLVGLDAWQKKQRSTDEILAEYNDHWYKNALELWQQFIQTTKNPMPSRFFRMLDNMIRDELIKNVKVYGASKDEHLCSINQELFVAKWSIVTALFDNLLADVIEQYLAQVGASTLVELGCGSGSNLFKLHEKLFVHQVIGGDICSNAVLLGKQILSASNISGDFYHFDYYGKESIVELTKDIKDKYILFTSHSIEQIQLEKTNFVEQIQKLAHKPEVIIHFEPIVYKDDDSFVNEICQTYAKMNLYNSDLLEVMRQHEKKKQIEIIDIKKAVFGMGAFNPTSVLIWKCL